MEDDVTREWAASGVVELTGRAGAAPRRPPGRAASMAADLGRRFAAATGVAVDGAGLLAERAAFTGHSRRGRISAGGATRLLPTGDGWAVVSCARPDDPALLGALIGRALCGPRSEVWPAVAEWVRAHPGAALGERAALLGLAAGPIPPASAAVAPPTPAVSTTATPRATDRTGTPRTTAPTGASAALVVDFSALWAGPLCAHLLGLAGSRVVKVETPRRADGARRGDPDFYRLLHGGHAAVVLDPDDLGERHELAALVAAADVVIEASRPRALTGFGLDAQAAVARGATWISITAWGREDQRVGFGDDVAAAAGLVAREPDGTPLFCGDALADPLAGLSAAVAAVEAPAQLHDVAMGPVVAATLDGSTGGPARRGPTGWILDTPSGPAPVSAPHGRSPASRSARHGEDTVAVLRSMGIRATPAPRSPGP